MTLAANVAHTPAFVVLGKTKFHKGKEDDQGEDGVPFDAVIDHIDREITLKTSCKSLPYSVAFYFCFIWSAWLKCDTYNYGVGSSVNDTFSTVNIDQDFCGSMKLPDPCTAS